MLKRLLSHPVTRDLILDDLDVFDVHRELINQKRFLQLLYEEWYSLLAEALPEGDALALEIGSGAGFMKAKIPRLISSDIVEHATLIDLVLDAHSAPFSNDSFGAIFMVDVLHHLPNINQFFREAGRIIQENGTVAMIEPWMTPWSQFVYSKFHHEPFHPESTEWDFPSSGPMSGANGALPWIVFERDRSRFEAEFPEWKIQAIKPIMPFSYLISGGVSMRSLAPGWSYSIIRSIEKSMTRWNRYIAMFAMIILRKQDI